MADGNVMDKESEDWAETMLDSPNTQTLVPIDAQPATIISANSRAEAVRKLIEQVPHNQYGIPTYLYRVDLIPSNFHEMDAENQADIIRSAEMNVLFEEGFPTTDDGMPIWAQFQFESREDYSLFQKYLTQTPRQLYELAMDSGIPVSQLRDKFDLNYWHARALAYDLFKTIQMESLRTQRIMELGDTHYLMANGVLKKLNLRLQETDFEDMESKDLIKALKDVTGMQRIALGLPVNGGVEPQKSEEMEMRLRRVARAHGVSEENKRSQSNGMSLADMDADMIEMAEELIIRHTKKS